MSETSEVQEFVSVYSRHSGHHVCTGLVVYRHLEKPCQVLVVYVLRSGKVGYNWCWPREVGQPVRRPRAGELDQLRAAWRTLQDAALDAVMAARFRG